MAPFGNAMRLVNREEGDLRGAQEGAERLPAGALRGDVEQVEIAVAQPVLRLPPVGIDAGEAGGADTHRLGGAKLVVHQRDPRGSDAARAVQSAGKRGGEGRRGY